jgi:hypothetical protein
MAAKAHEISLEAGSKMAAAMKDVINAAAGLTGFVIESARDLLQYMVRRGQMTQEEADKLIREVEVAMPKRPAAPGASSHATAAHKPAVAPATKTAALGHAASPVKTAKVVVAKPAAKKAPAPKASASKAAAGKSHKAKATPAKSAAKKPVAKKTSGKSPAAKRPAPKKAPVKKAATKAKRR